MRFLAFILTLVLILQVVVAETCQECSSNFDFKSSSDLSAAIVKHKEKCTTCYKPAIETSKDELIAGIDDLKKEASAYFDKVVKNQAESSLNAKMVTSKDSANDFVCGYQLGVHTTDNKFLKGWFNNVYQKGSENQISLTKIPTKIDLFRFATGSNYTSELDSFCLGFGKNLIDDKQHSACISGNLFNQCNRLTTRAYKFLPLNGSDNKKSLILGTYDLNIRSIWSEDLHWFVAAFDNINSADPGSVVNFCNSFLVERSDEKHENEKEGMCCVFGKNETARICQPAANVYKHKPGNFFNY